jgi:hypothetical protein
MSGTRFEYHLTVSGDDAAAAGLAAWAAQRGVKFTHILLARGKTVSQPMLTVRADGTAESVLADASAMAGELRAVGFEVTRVKVEASPFIDGLARTADRYFEHHIKLLLPPSIDESALADVVTPHGAHLSRNARRIREDGRAERFVTQRCYRTGTAGAVAELDRLIEALRDAGHTMLSVEREYVVYDSDPAVDAGWIS